MKLDALKNKSKLLGERQVVEALNYITWMAGEKKNDKSGKANESRGSSVGYQQKRCSFGRDCE